MRMRESYGRITPMYYFYLIVHPLKAINWRTFTIFPTRATLTRVNFSSLISKLCPPPFTFSNTPPRLLIPACTPSTKQPLTLVSLDVPVLDISYKCTLHVFCDWSYSRSIMLSRFIHAAAVSVLHSPLGLDNSPLHGEPTICLSTRQLLNIRRRVLLAFVMSYSHCWRKSIFVYIDGDSVGPD